MSGGVFLRIAAFGLALVIVFLVLRLKRLPVRATLGLYLPSWRAALLFAALFAGLAAGQEWVASALGGPSAVPWTNAGAAALALRTLAIVVLAPVTEELIFRGLLYTRISETRLKAAGAIVITALLFAAAHFDRPTSAAAYAALAQPLVDGLYFGLVRFKTNSTPLTILLHAAGNAVAVWQRMP